MSKSVFLLLFFFCCSCATVFNNPYQEIQLKTNEPTRLVVLEDSLFTPSKKHFFKVKRSEEFLPITIEGDSLSKDIYLKPFNSFAYASNFFYPSLWSVAAWLIDRNSPKRYGFPTLVSVDLSSQGEEYFDYDAFTETKQLIKITPLKLVGIHNASVEVAYERVTSSSFSTQLMLSALLPSSLSTFGDDPEPKTKGFRVALEERFYFKKKAPFGPHFAVEIDYLNNQSYKRREFLFYQGDVNLGNDYAPSYEDTFLVNRTSVSRNIKFGYQKEVNTFFMDFYVGLGLRTRNVSHLERTNPSDILLVRMGHITDFEYNRIKEGKSTTLSFPLNLRFGWRL